MLMLYCSFVFQIKQLKYQLKVKSKLLSLCDGNELEENSFLSSEQDYSNINNGKKHETDENVTNLKKDIALLQDANDALRLENSAMKLDLRNAQITNKEKHTALIQQHHEEILSLNEDLALKEEENISLKHEITSLRKEFNLESEKHSAEIADCKRTENELMDQVKCLKFIHV